MKETIYISFLNLLLLALLLAVVSSNSFRFSVVSILVEVVEQPKQWDHVKPMDPEINTESSHVF